MSTAKAFDLLVLNQHRQSVAGLVTTLLMGSTLLMLGLRVQQALDKSTPQSTLELTISPTPIKESVAPSPVVLPNKPNQPQTKPELSATKSISTAEAPKPSPVAVPTAEPADTQTQTQAKANEAAALSPKPVAALSPSPPSPDRPVAAASPRSESVSSGVSAEDAYTLMARSQLNQNKRYPTGREASMQRPSGKVILWFVLGRAGNLQDLGIHDSSNSMILDNAALSTVRRTQFLALPEKAWPGQSSHRFTVTLEFTPLS